MNITHSYHRDGTKAFNRSKLILLFLATQIKILIWIQICGNTRQTFTDCKQNLKMLINDLFSARANSRFIDKIYDRLPFQCLEHRKNRRCNKYNLKTFNMFSAFLIKNYCKPVHSTFELILVVHHLRRGTFLHHMKYLSVFRNISF